MATNTAQAQNPPPNQPDDWFSQVRDVQADFYHITHLADSFYAANPAAAGQKDYGRWAAFWQSRVGENSEAPGSFLPAFEALYESFFTPPPLVCGHSSGYDAKWTSIGPDVTPSGPATSTDWAGGLGVVTKVKFASGAANPGNIYLGTGASGLWKSSGSWGSIHWQNLTDASRLPALGITSLDINPFNPQEMYVASALTPHILGFGYGLGIIKTTDGGLTWSPTGLTYEPDEFSQPGERLTCLDVAIHPVYPNIVFALCGRKIWRSQDAGATFAPVPVGPNGEIELDEGLVFRDIVFHPTDANIIYASSDDQNANVPGVGNNNGGARLFRSSDAGLTWSIWQEATLPLPLPVERMNIAVSPAAPGNVYLAGCYSASNRFIHFFDGTGWHQINNPGVDASWHKNTFVVSPTNPNRVYWGGVHLFRCDNIGAASPQFMLVTTSISPYFPNTDNWMHADVRDLDIADGGNGNDLLIAGHDGGVSLSTDNGTTWTDLNGTGLSITQFYGISSSAQDYSAVIGGCQDLGLESFNPASGGSWRNVSVTADGARCLVDLFNPQVFYGQTWGNVPNTGGRRIYMSTNGGLTWGTEISPPAAFPEGHKYLRPPADGSKRKALYRPGRRTQEGKRRMGPTWRFQPRCSGCQC